MEHRVLTIWREILKWYETIKMGVIKKLAYKNSFLLMIIAPVLVFFLIQYNLWSTILLEKGSMANGYTLESMIEYQAWIMMVTLLAQGYHSMNLSHDIRLGRISSYLIYPFEFWKFHTAQFISTQIIQFVMFLVSFATFWGLGLLTLRSPVMLLKGILVCQLVGFLWFGISYTVGLMAFWLEETWVLRVIFGTLVQFLSGAMLPLEFFPTPLQEALKWTPFPFMSWLPAKVFMGEATFEFLDIGILVVWIALLALLARWVFKKGVRLYSAAGM